MGTILLFYNYVDIQNPQDIMAWQRSVCQKLNLKGRVWIGTEGINGTLGGTTEQTDAYKKELLAHPLFNDTDMKESPGSADDFPRLAIKIKKEIVGLGAKAAGMKASLNTHLTPEQAHALMEENPKDLIILDTRNDYETRIGTFKGAIGTPTKTFREFPDYIDNNAEIFKNKTILMACTGGIRCERASTYLQSKGVAKNVYQIKGGICRYTEKYPDGFFRGKNYVFDRRLSVKVNDDILGTCDLCEKPCDTYTNCMNANCNRHFIGCAPCNEKNDTTCSTTCSELLRRGKVKRRKIPV